MATMSGLVGGLSGKMGNAVFRQRNGQQIVAQYQPIVRNPRSANQSSQRARFKLMSQLAAVVADGLGGTMSILSRPERGASPRNNFVKENFNLCVGSFDSGTAEATATINLAQLQLTKSFKPLGTMFLDTQQGDSEVKVTINNMPNEITTVRLVTIGSSNNTPIVTDIRTVQVANNEIVEVIPLPAFADAKKAVVLAYGIIPLSSQARQNLSNITTLDGNEASLVLEQYYTDGSITETITIGEEAVWQN